MPISPDRIVEFLGVSIRNGDAFVLLTPPYSAEFAFVDRVVVDEWIKKQNSDRADFNKKLSVISELLRGILARAEDFSLTAVAEKNKDITSEELQRQLELVRKNLHNSHLQNRYDLKANSKAPSFNSIDWDVKKKFADAQRDFIPFPYATLKIQYQREFGGDPFSLLGGRAFDWVQINFSADEIAYFKKVLDKVYQTVERYEDKEQR